MFPWDVVVGLLNKFIQDPEQRAKAERELRDAYTKFLEMTSSPVERAYRMIVQLAAAWDLLRNGAGYAVSTAHTAGLDPAFMVLVEVALMLWPFAGKPIMDLIAGLSAYATKKSQEPTRSEKDANGR